jgi:hypothetical protein
LFTFRKCRRVHHVGSAASNDRPQIAVPGAAANIVRVQRRCHPCKCDSFGFRPPVSAVEQRAMMFVTDLL